MYWNAVRSVVVGVRVGGVGAKHRSKEGRETEQDHGDARDRDSADRRSVSIRVLPDRNREVFYLYRGMNDAMDDVCAEYTEAELELIADFLQRSAEAGRTSTSELGQDS